MSGDEDQVEEIVTVSCSECDWTYTGPPKGRNSAPWRKGLHMRNSHKQPGAGKGAKRTPVVEDPDQSGAAQVISIVRDAASAVGGRGAPTADALAKAAGRGISIVTTGIAAAAVETDPMFGEGPEQDRMRDELIDELSLSPKAAEDVIRPVARMFAPTSLNQRYGRKMVDNVDVLASFAELSKVGFAWRRYFRARAEFAAAGLQTYPASPPPAAPVFMPPAAPPPAPPGVQVPPTVPPGHATSPAPQQGIVVDATMVQALIAQRQNGHA